MKTYKVTVDDYGTISWYNEKGQRHREDGPSIEYADGFKVFSWHGIRMPEKYIMTPSDKINPEEALSETNAEIRMAVIQKCGFQHFKKHLPTKTISQGHNCDLLEFKLGNDMLVRGLHVRWTDKHASKETIIPVPGIKENFGVDCPDNINDCEQVRRWTLKLKQTDNLIMET